MPRSTEKAFSLIEAVVVIAIMAILAGAAVPLVLKGLNQQREQKTRESMQIIWEGMFGARNKRVASMRADFGFNPTANMTDFSRMTTPGGVGAYAPDRWNGGLPWGWNGPYWTGSTRPLAGTQGNPVDGWGNAFQLSYVPGPPATWQLRSGGPNGVLGGTIQDDLVYPSSPASVSGYMGTLIVNVQRTSSTATTDLPVTITVTDRLNGVLNFPAPTTPPPPPGWPFPHPPKSPKSWTYTVVPGTVRVVVNTYDQLIDLKPGELQTLTFQFD